MKAIALDSWISCIIEGKSYDVLDIHGHYILIVEEDGRLVWNYCKLFDISGSLDENRKRYDFRNIEFI